MPFFFGGGGEFCSLSPINFLLKLYLNNSFTNSSAVAVKFRIGQLYLYAGDRPSSPLPPKESWV